MKITSIELEEDIDVHLRSLITSFTERYGKRPDCIILSRPLLGWLSEVCQKKAFLLNNTIGVLKAEQILGLKEFEGMQLITTARDNIIEVY